jgi:OTT_1508-like deaminase
MDVVALLHHISDKVSEHFPQRKDATSFEKYLHKIGSIGADLKQLATAARSPRYIEVFNITPKITPLEKMQAPVSPFPESKEAWQDQMKRSLSYHNYHSSYDDEIKFFNDTFREDCIVIAKKHPYAPQHMSVHCEVKIALRLFAEKARPAAYPYIGASKLSCPGCSSFLMAFSKVHGTKLLTKGQHGKAYFPWGFPKACPKARAVLERQYEEINRWFVPWYNGVSKDLPASPIIENREQEDKVRKRVRRPPKRKFESVPEEEQ